jgi:hypothetical protein
MSRNKLTVTNENFSAIMHIMPIAVAVGNIITWGLDHALGYYVDVIDPNSEEDWPYWEIEDGPEVIPTHKGYQIAVALLGEHMPRTIPGATARELCFKLSKFTGLEM